MSVDTFRGSFTSAVESSALPHARVTLLIELGSGRSSVDGVPLRVLVAGLQSKPVRFEQSGDVECVEVRLPPSSALALGLAVGEIHDRVEPVDQFFGQQADILAEQLAHTAAADRPTMLRDSLCTRVARQRPTLSMDAIEVLEQADPCAAVGDIVSDLGGSRSALWRRVTSMLGVSPQQYLMLRRFETGVDLLVAGRTIADAASCAGYVDQSHFHRHVQRFAESTPGQLGRRIDATYVQDGDSAPQ